MTTKDINVRDALTARVFSAGWSATKWMPEKAATSFFRNAADLLWWQDAGGVGQLKVNLARVKPDLDHRELEKLTRAGMRSYMRYWCEAFRLPAMKVDDINERFELHGIEILDQALAQGRGALMIPGHMANWDLAGAWACQRYGGLTTVAERLKPEELFDKFLAYRQTLGMEVLPLGDADVTRTLIRRLKEGRLVALLGDRDLTSSGIPVDFFGARASFPAGPALLALLTGAPLHPVTMHYDGKKAVGVVHPEVTALPNASRSDNIAHMTQQIATAFEAGIAEHPEDWHMLQKVWLDHVKPR